MNGRRILVCDDVKDARELYADALEQAGHDVFVVSNGTDALTTIQTGHIEVAIIDIALPDMSGYDIARAVRADPTTKDLRLIAVTGLAREEDRAEATDAGFDAHLAKPVHLQELFGALDQG
ncbi:MAG: response regulator [Kofleriaceae bacterium]|nr:response regulator [Kofleriaceae bacterium]